MGILREINQTVHGMCKQAQVPMGAGGTSLGYDSPRTEAIQHRSNLWTWHALRGMARGVGNIIPGFVRLGGLAKGFVDGTTTGLDDALHGRSFGPGFRGHLGYDMEEAGRMADWIHRKEMNFVGNRVRDGIDAGIRHERKAIESEMGPLKDKNGVYTPEHVQYLKDLGTLRAVEDGTALGAELVGSTFGFGKLLGMLGRVTPAVTKAPAAESVISAVTKPSVVGKTINALTTSPVAMAATLTGGGVAGGIQSKSNQDAVLAKAIEKNLNEGIESARSSLRRHDVGGRNDKPSGAALQSR